MGLSGALHSFAEGTRLPILAVQQIYAFLSHLFFVLIIKLDFSRFIAEYDSFFSEVEVDGAIETLDAILDEERHLDVLVLEELKQLLLYYHHLVA